MDNITIKPLPEKLKANMIKYSWVRCESKKPTWSNLAASRILYLYSCPLGLILTGQVVVLILVIVILVGAHTYWAGGQRWLAPSTSYQLQRILHCILHFVLQRIWHCILYCKLHFRCWQIIFEKKFKCILHCTSPCILSNTYCTP